MKINEAWGKKFTWENKSVVKEKPRENVKQCENKLIGKTIKWQ